jgi:hypothetical protein
MGKGFTVKTRKFRNIGIEPALTMAQINNASSDLTLKIMLKAAWIKVASTWPSMKTCFLSTNLEVLVSTH